jgi:hypothetical protein
MKLSWICMGTLHVHARHVAIVFGETTLETVYDSAAAQEVLDASDSGAAPLLCLFHAAEICPISGNQRAASVGKD